MSNASGEDERSLLAGLTPDTVSFRTSDDVLDPIRQACAESGGLAAFHELGVSEEGRHLYGVVMGRGTCTVSLVAGAHSDEPVGPETLRTLVLEGLRRRDELEELWAAFRFVVVPHVNPDGEARNRPWMEAWPSVAAYLRHVFREPPGRDLEFGFPDLRMENRAVTGFLERHAPYALHASLHGMGFSEGAMLLIERHWAGRTQNLRDRFAAAAFAHGLRLHDHNRKGEKGFFYIEPGFTTTPEGGMMRAHFQALGDEPTAALFRDSSMEYVRSLGGDPLCLVTELPLFVVPGGDPVPGCPAAYLALLERLPEIKLRLLRGEDVEEEVQSLGLLPLEITSAVRLQLATIEMGLRAVQPA